MTNLVKVAGTIRSTGDITALVAEFNHQVDALPPKAKKRRRKAPRRKPSSMPQEVQDYRDKIDSVRMSFGRDQRPTKPHYDRRP